MWWRRRAGRCGCKHTGAGACSEAPGVVGRCPAFEHFLTGTPIFAHHASLALPLYQSDVCVCEECSTCSGVMCACVRGVRTSAAALTALVASPSLSLRCSRWRSAGKPSRLRRLSISFREWGAQPFFFFCGRPAYSPRALHTAVPAPQPGGGGSGGSKGGAQWWRQGGAQWWQQGGAHTGRPRMGTPRLAPITRPACLLVLRPPSCAAKAQWLQPITRWMRMHALTVQVVGGALAPHFP